jgi:hypothetical protein
MGDLPAALDWSDRAIATLQGVLRREPKHTQARDFLSNAHWGRGNVLTRLGRYPEALVEWDRAQGFDDG